jgi:hypothetical protein
VFILKTVKVLYFDTLLQVFILKVLTPRAQLGHLQVVWSDLAIFGNEKKEPASESGRNKNKKAASSERAAAEFKTQL